MAEGTDILGSVVERDARARPLHVQVGHEGQQGKLVKPGTYTVCIEAAREHGTYQLMRQPMDFAGADKQVDVPDQRHRGDRRVARLPQGAPAK